MITATVTAAPTLSSRVEVLSDPDAHGRVSVRTLGGGVGGWAEAGRKLVVAAYLLSDVEGNDDATPDADLAAVVDADADMDLTGPVSGEEYMDVLLRRQQQWVTVRGHLLAPRPLLEWFVRPGDEKHVALPRSTPAAKKTVTPRTYRSAASLRTERDRVEAEMRRVAGTDETPDRAMANLSPNARSKAAARAGRARFAKMDRDLEKSAALQKRLDELNGQIARAGARERSGSAKVMR